jgi:hypothetical protein
MEEEVAKVVCVLYDDLVTGYPRSHVRDDALRLGRVGVTYTSRPLAAA